MWSSAAQRQIRPAEVCSSTVSAGAASEKRERRRRRRRGGDPEEEKQELDLLCCPRVRSSQRDTAPSAPLPHPVIRDRHHLPLSSAASPPSLGPLALIPPSCFTPTGLAKPLCTTVSASLKYPAPKLTLFCCDANKRPKRHSDDIREYIRISTRTCQPLADPRRDYLKPSGAFPVEPVQTHEMSRMCRSPRSGASAPQD